MSRPSQGVALLLTVDVEEDMPRWVPERDITVTNIAALSQLQRLCDEFGVRPTYLTTYTVATDHGAAHVLDELRGEGRCEIGAHLHPWNTPPLPSGPETEALRATQIPVDTLRAKMVLLTATLEQVFATRPHSFRAGRFGLNGACVRILEDLGYTVDTSIVPGISFRNEGGEDFTDAPERPYFPDCDDPRRVGCSTVYEVPVSVGLTRSLPSWLRRLYLHLPRWTRLRGLLSHDYLGLIDQHWLYPALVDEADLLRLADVLIAARAPMLNVFLHSSELYPGASIYSRSPADVTNVFARLRRLLKHVMVRRNGWSCTLSEFRESQVPALTAKEPA